MSESDKISISARVSEKIYIKFQEVVLSKFKKTHGHLGKCVEESLILWIKENNGKKV